MRILLKGPFSPYSGYGNDLIGLAQTLIKRGDDVHVDPTHLQAPLPQEIADLLTKPITPPFDLTLVHVDPMSMELEKEIRRVSTYAVAITMWEWSSMAAMKGRSTMRKRLSNFDAAVAYDEVTKGALEPYFRGPIPVVQGGYDPSGWAPVERDWHEQNLYVCMLGQLHSRKNPFAAIRAVGELKNEFPEEAEPLRLSLKTTVPGLHSGMQTVYPWLRIFYDVWDHETVKAFYAAQHLLLAPSRGEGKNLPALEFQTTGGVVAATNWGGHTSWLGKDWAFPIDYQLVDDGKPGVQNAEVDVDHLKEILLFALRNRDVLKQKGELAAQVIPSMCSWESSVNRLFDRLGDVLPNPQAFKALAAAR